MGTEQNQHHQHDPQAEPGRPLDDHSLPVIEEPLDPANQSLADALRASFRVLKVVMFVLAIAFVFSGVFTVEQTERAVLARFGRQEGAPREPGLHFALPYPIDEVVKVQTGSKTIKVAAFWLVIRDADRGKPLNELSERGKGLNPAVDGALLTGDKAIMHVELQARYLIKDANQYVRNVSNEETLLQAVLQNAAVAEAARTTAEVILKFNAELAAAIRSRAQKVLDDLQTGIRLETVTVPTSHYPLQVKDAFIGVSDAENRKIRLINEAESKRIKTLNEAAGQAWEPLHKQIERLDQLPDGPQRDEVLKKIEESLVNEATGKAGSKIQLARRDRDKIISDAQAEVATFKALLPEYRRNPELLMRRLRQRMLNELYEQVGVSKWLLPAGAKQIVLWFSRDPKETRDAERARMEKLTGANR